MGNGALGWGGVGGDGWSRSRGGGSLGGGRGRLMAVFHSVGFVDQ